MSGYTGSDGSALAGGLNPSGVVKALSVDAGGNLNVNASVSATNPSVGTEGSAAPASSTLIGGSDGTNLQGALVESASHPNLRAAIYNGANEVAVDTSGRLTLVPNSSVNAAQIGGQAPKLDNTNELGVSLYGKNAAAGDTAVLVDSGGRVYVSQTLGGNVISGTNPEPNIAQIQQEIINGAGFCATSGKQTSGGAIITGLSIFNPNASGKTLYIYSIKVAEAGSNTHSLQVGITSDPALANAATVTNRKNGGGTSVANATYLNAATTFSTGSVAEVDSISGNTTGQFLEPGEYLVVPPNSGIGVLVGTSTNVWAATIKWVEF